MDELPGLIYSGFVWKYQLGKLSKSSYKEFRNKASAEDLEKAIKKGYKFDEFASFYQIISGIGHECSPKKKRGEYEDDICFVYSYIGEKYCKKWR